MMPLGTVEIKVRNLNHSIRKKVLKTIKEDQVLREHRRKINISSLEQSYLSQMAFRLREESKAEVRCQGHYRYVICRFRTVSVIQCKGQIYLNEEHRPSKRICIKTQYVF